MITSGKKWHYLPVKRLPALLRGITSNHNGDFYCLNCFHSYNTKKTWKIWKSMQWSWLLLRRNTSWRQQNIKIQPGESSVKAPAITSCENNPEKSYTEKKTKHTRSGYSLFANCLFESTKKQTWLLQRWRLSGKVL